MEFGDVIEKINEFSDAFIEKIKNLPQTILYMPDDEKIAWGSIIVGVIFVISAWAMW